MNLLILILIFIPLFSSPNSVQAQPLPEVIGALSGHGFGSDFCWVGDQNGDGYDDLLVKAEMEYAAELYYGGEEMNDEPDFTFEPYLEGRDQRIALNMNYLGNIIPDSPPFIAMKSFVRGDQPLSILNLYETGDGIDNEPDISFNRPWNGGDVIGVKKGYMTKPSDFNGDGTPDMFAYQRGDAGRLYCYFGGEDFDTIPDWAKIIPSAGAGGAEYSAGYDVNDDGYDDWAIHYIEDGYRHDGYYLFFGGEEPDDEVDVELEGNHALAGNYEGDICGGDYNGDGFGDIVTASAGGFIMGGEIHIHFGRPAIREEVDIIIHGERDYGEDFRYLGGFVGAPGDYNGDGVDDFVSWILGRPKKIVIFAGNPDWVVNSVSNDLPEQFQLLFEAMPNPFNSELSINYALSKSGKVRLSIYDINGREIKIIENRFVKKGNRERSWSFGNAGVYFIVLKTDYVQKAVKVVCIP